MKKIEDAYALLECETLDALSCAADTIASAMGFTRFLFGLSICPSSPVSLGHIISTFPEGWMRTYIERDYATIDPTVQHAYASNLPLVWSSSVFSTPEQLAFAEEAARWGLTAGLSAPIRGKANELSVLSLVVDRELADTRSLGIDQLANGQLLACFMHEAMIRLLADTQSKKSDILLEAPVALSGRERDCLLWSAAGKTSWEISKILSISERTVNFHITKAARKLGTYGRRHAISRAMALGLLSP